MLACPVFFTASISMFPRIPKPMKATLTRSLGGAWGGNGDAITGTNLPFSIIPSPAAPAVPCRMKSRRENELMVSNLPTRVTMMKDRNFGLPDEGGSNSYSGSQRHRGQLYFEVGTF